MLVQHLDRDKAQSELREEHLGCLSLAGACGALRRSAEVQLEGGGEREEAALRHGRDDEARLRAKVLVAVLKVGVNLRDCDVDVVCV